MPNFSRREEIKGLAIWWVILIVVVVIVVGVVAFSLLFPRELRKPNEQKPAADTTASENKYDYEPGPITVLQGKIEEVAQDKLIVAVSAQEKNPALQGRKFEVYWNEQTKIILIESNFLIRKQEGRSEIILLDRKSQEIPEAQKTFLTLADLQIGTRIIVLGAEDLENQESFTAREIYKR